MKIVIQNEFLFWTLLHSANNSPTIFPPPPPKKIAFSIIIQQKMRRKAWPYSSRKSCDVLVRDWFQFFNPYSWQIFEFASFQTVRRRVKMYTVWWRIWWQALRRRTEAGPSCTSSNFILFKAKVSNGKFLRFCLNKFSLQARGEFEFKLPPFQLPRGFGVSLWEWTYARSSLFYLVKKEIKIKRELSLNVYL